MPQTPQTNDAHIAASRYELKFVCNDTAEMGAAVAAWIRSHPAGFRQAHPSRRVNSIYFDSEEWSSLADNLAGVPDRCKLRLRWYGCGTVLQDSEMQVKWKRSELGWKITCPAPIPIDLADTTWRAVLERLRQQDLGPVTSYLAPRIRPGIIIAYDRKYLVSADGSVRLTVDTSLAAYAQTLSGRPNLRRAEPLMAPLVLELKAPAQLSSRLAEISRGIPLRVTACSKFANSLTARGFGL